MHVLKETYQNGKTPHKFNHSSLWDHFPLYSGTNSCSKFTISFFFFFFITGCPGELARTLTNFGIPKSTTKKKSPVTPMFVMFGLYKIRTWDLIEVKDLFLSHARLTKPLGIIHKLFLHTFLIPYESNKKCKITHMTHIYRTRHVLFIDLHNFACLSFLQRRHVQSGSHVRGLARSSLVVLMQVCYNDWNVGECFLPPQPKVAETNIFSQKRFRMGRYSLFGMAKAWTSVLLMS